MSILLISILCLQPGDETPDQAVKAIEALVATGETETAARRLEEAASKHAGSKKLLSLATKLLASDVPALALAAARAMEALGLDEAVAPLKKALEKRAEDGEFVKVALKALGGTGSEKAVEVLESFLKKGGETAATAAGAMGRLRHKKSVDVLVAALSDAPDSLAAEIVSALKTCTGEEMSNAAAWGPWWKKTRSSFKFPGKAAVRDRRGGTDVATALKKLGDAAKEFKQYPSEHYLILSNADESKVKTAQPKFEELYAMVKKDHGFADPESLMIVYHFKDEAGIREFSNSERGGGGGGGMMGGFASPEGWLAFYDSEKLNLDHIVFHEGTHQVLSVCLKIKDPNWFHEGMAEYVAAEKRGSERHLVSAVKDMISKSQLVPFGQLFEEGIRGRQMAYLQSGMAVRFLLQKHGEKLFATYLKQLADGKTGAPDFLKLFGYANAAAFETAWKDYWLKK